MEATTRTGFTEQSFEAFLESRHEPGWLLDARRAAWRLFQELPWPSRGDEEWSRTDIRTFKLDRFAPPSDQPAPDSLTVPLLDEGVDLGGHVTAADGMPAAATLSEKWSRAGCCSAI